MGSVLLGDLFVPVVPAGIFGGISWVGGRSGPKNPRQHHLDVLVPQHRLGQAGLAWTLPHAVPLSREGVGFLPWWLKTLEGGSRNSRLET